MKFLYHANCNDGSAAALAAWLVHGDEGNDYFPVQYGYDPPNGLEGQDVVMLDFSYPRSVIDEMRTYAKSILIIDHHKTAEAELSKSFLPEEGKCSITCIFDMDRSGAVLAWIHFFPATVIPDLFKHIEDRDMWWFRMEGTNEIHKALQIYPDWQKWLELDSHQLRVEGTAITRFMIQKSMQIINTPPRPKWYSYIYVPVYNLPAFMISDTLHDALEKYPEAQFAVAYFDLPDKRVYSLRSRKNGFDVSEIAKANSGGGHHSAAGFTVAINEERWNLLPG